MWQCVIRPYVSLDRIYTYLERKCAALFAPNAIFRWVFCLVCFQDEASVGNRSNATTNDMVGIT